MRPDSRPVNLTLNLPSLPDEAVVEIQDFLYEILEHFTTYYGYQIDRFYEDRFYEDRSYDSLVHPDPNLRPPDDDPPITLADREHRNIKFGDHTHPGPPAGEPGQRGPDSMR